MRLPPHQILSSRRNPLNIQMIPHNLRDKIFGPKQPNYHRDSITKALNHLQKFVDINEQQKETKHMSLELPKLPGSTISKFYPQMALELSHPYLKLAKSLSNMSIPQMPSNWVMESGWTKYNSDGSYASVDYPDESALILDVETIVTEGGRPAMAVALSPTNWYSWCSPHLLSCDYFQGSKLRLLDLIPMSTPAHPRLIVGHNVSFDRSLIREEYLLEGTNNKFIDTMSLHIACCGFCNEQRIAYRNLPEDELWMTLGSRNSLAEVYSYHCGGEISKEMRNLFITGSTSDIRHNFSPLMKYCASDVLATCQIFNKLFKLYIMRFPSVISFCGMLEMGSLYLPLNHNWDHYLRQSHNKFVQQERKIKRLLLDSTNRAMVDRENHVRCPWTYNLDWRVVKQRRKHLSDYPQWYRQLCDRPLETSTFTPNLTLSLRIVPKLLKMSYHGCPLFYDPQHGWGFVVPSLRGCAESEHESSFPPKLALLNIVKYIWRRCGLFADVQGDDDFDDLEVRDQTYQRVGLWFSENVGDVYAKRIQIPQLPPTWSFCQFKRSAVSSSKIGVIFSKEFLPMLEKGEMVSELVPNSANLLIWAITMTYWRNNLERIKSQYVVWNGDRGAILPRAVVSGTITRRAVEPTWMTASNSRGDRIGSELKSMVQTPEDYCFVGADVDLEELWIASILGDAHFSGIHGSTAFSWMLHQGSKSEGSDLHSRTAEIVRLSRSQAKIFNFSRIYGAGLNSTAAMMMSCSLSSDEALRRATFLYRQTKGRRVNRVWVGGSESDIFNVMESIAYSEHPRTPVLRANISQAMTTSAVGNKFIRSRLNWVIQSSAVDFLHLLLTATLWLARDAGIEARLALSIHDEVRFIVPSSERYRMGLVLQIAHLLTRCAFSHSVGMDDLPLSVAFFSSVEIDYCIRKDVRDQCVTPSNPLGLLRGYNVPDGESLDIFEIIDEVGAN